MSGQINVGRGILDAPLVKLSEYGVGRGILDAPLVELSEYGVGRGILDAPLVEAIEFLNNRNNEIAIVKYVIMPNHVHLIVLVKDAAQRRVKDAAPYLWQRSFHDFASVHRWSI